MEASTNGNFKFLKILKSPNAEILEMLNNNTIGTEGHSMLYRHLGVNDKIEKIAEPYYVNLSRNERIIGTCCFCRRVTTYRGGRILSFYIRYFSFKEIYRTKSTKEKSASSKSLIKEEVLSVLAGKGLEVNPNEKFYHYAYVDPRNLRSISLCKEFGFEHVREYTTIIFNRLNPKIKSEISEITPAEQNEVKTLLMEFNSGLNMFSLDNVFHAGQYFVIRDHHNKIVAGVHANPDRWKIYSLPGRSGKMILNTFSHLPYLNRLFNKNYSFVTFEGIYHALGKEQALENLLESLLARYQINSGIMVVDANSQLCRTLKSLRLGLVNKLNKEVKGSVMCKFNNFTREEKKVFKEYPVYISGIDVT